MLVDKIKEEIIVKGNYIVYISEEDYEEKFGDKIQFPLTLNGVKIKFLKNLTLGKGEYEIYMRIIKKEM